jgi:hypothetical protein
MIDPHDPTTTTVAESPATPAAAPEQAQPNGFTEGPPTAPTWHVEAGRKGAQRIHQLIQEGKLYEQEHGLKRGRQRLRQLIEEGKLYEQEHGLRPGRPAQTDGTARVSSDQALKMLLHSLLRLVKPSVRRQLATLLQDLESTNR